MRTKILKTSIIALISVVFCFVAAKTIQACAGGDEDFDNRSYSVFTPEIIQQPDKAPFFLSYRYFYSHDNYEVPETVPTMTERNTAEWVAFFTSAIKKEDIEWLIYNSSARHIELIKKNFAGEKVNIDTINKPFLSQLKSEKNIPAILDYILLAKRSEVYFNPEYYSWDPPVYDTGAIGKLIPVFRKNFSQPVNPFLKNRYGFQLARALCINGRYNECVDFIDKQFKPVKEAGSMYYRTLGYKARAWYKLGNYSQANYLYSYLFDHDPCGRYPAFKSFHPQEETDWNATLQLATSTREKEILWHLLGIYNDPLRGMEEIYALNPKSDLLPLLLVRSVNLAEEYALVNPVRYGDFYDENYTPRPTSQSDIEGFGYSNEPIKMDSSSNKLLITFINRVIRENKIQKPAVWQLSAAFLLLLDGSLNASSKIVSAFRIDPKDSLLSGQAEIIKGILAVKKITGIAASDEKSLYTNLQKIAEAGGEGLRKDNAIRYMLSQLSTSYDKIKDSLKKELCYPQGKTFYRSSKNVQRMIDFMNRKDLNALEKFMITRYPLNIIDLYEVKAVSLMYEYRFKDAIKEFERTEGAGSGELYGNPFTIHITDCHDCDHQAAQKTKYSKLGFAKKMVELMAKGDTAVNADERAQNYFLYANGLYNMTYHGNGRFIHETRINSAYDSYMYDEEERAKAMKTSYYDCKEALTWYQKALSLSKNKEFRAKCTWMSAKCEHNIWLTTIPGENEVRLNNDFVPGKFFNEMKTTYSDSKYYQEVINECGYFCTFITHSKRCIRDSLSISR